ncbi:hypothetical protein QE370_003266 [Aeromicrobium sp. SORGH_AS981]|uniref:Ig domain-containing protein n=1 Tax=Aeromicrobium sp. SORGH_AS_0981 TaxID=3041802 RepID=UPI002858D1F8|nr:Ig domain-containing protein [Aeromicrobium sp. SORGH_AS_0981]MDR6120082.1 hypothetical protein [Aeromicrobium sp. SORGH_AS_0981]
MSVATLVALVLSALAFGALPAQAEPEAKPTVGLLNANASASWDADTRDKLKATGGFADVVVLPESACGAGTPTLQDLQQYDAVMVWNDCNFQDPRALGDVLADYVDGGGHVVVAAFAGADSIAGRFSTEDYSAVVSSGGGGGGRAHLVVDDADDPLLAGVGSFDGGGSSYRIPVAPAEGSTVVAHWSTGEPLVVRGEKSIYLNFFPPSSDARSDFWDASTDGTRLLANALNATLAPVVKAPSFTSDATASFTAGVEGSFTVTTKGKPAATISATSELPSGLTLTDNGDGTATLAGTPAAGTGGLHDVALKASNGNEPDATQTLELTVDEAPGITSPTAAGFTVGEAGSFTVTTVAGYPSDTALTVAGDLPSGLSFVDNGDGTATLAGTPANGSAATYPVTVEASNAKLSSTQDVTLTVSLATQTVAITSDAPANAVVGQTYAVTTSAGASGQPVVLSVDEASADVCAIDGSTVTFQHPGACVVDADQQGDGRYAAASTSQTVTVAQSATSTTLSVARDTLSAAVKPTAPGAGAPTGTVTFSVGGEKVGTAPVVDGVATLAYRVEAGKERAVAAAYAGDADFVGSSDSTARQDPVVTAKVTSAVKKSASGWYRTPVTVSFQCAPTSGALVGSCPAPVTLGRDGAGQSVTRTVLAADGGATTVTVAGIDVDRTAPRVAVRGVSKGRVYAGQAPRATCTSRDALSGIASCRTSRKVSGETVTVTARATDRAGNTSTASVTYRVARFFVAGATFRDGAWQVRDGQTYQVVALTSGTARPQYYNAAPRGSRPTASGSYLVRAGKQAGLNRFSLPVRMDRGMSRKGHWVLGVKTGSTLHTIPVRAQR